MNTSRLADARLYLVLAAADTDVLEPALRGGVDIVQLREKNMDDADLVEAAKPFRAACEDHGALFVLNDRPDLAARCGTLAVHIGQNDAPFKHARALVGPKGIVGVSASSPAEMLAAQEAGANYVGVQAIFPTPIKPDEIPSGLWLVEAAARTLAIPWFAIGGIDLDNISDVVAAGASRVAVVRAIRDADDPEAAAVELRRALDR